jgi:hypothetical protein
MLKELLDDAGRQMRERLRAQLLPHRGETGRDREAVFREFLRQYLPQRFSVSEGFLIDSAGNRSRQLDVVISDSTVSPLLELSSGVRFFPCETVVAVGQVKSHVTSRDELEGALSNLESAKTLDRSSGGHALGRVTGEPLKPTENHLDALFTFLIVADKCLSADTAQEFMCSEWIPRHDCHLWPNLVFALDRYVLTFACERGVCPNPIDARGVALIEGDQGMVLSRFFLLLAQAIEVTRTAPVVWWDYLQGDVDWNARVFCSTEDPPPLLSQLPRPLSS